MKYFYIIVILMLSFNLNAQDTLYVAAKNGLNIRENPIHDSRVIDKIVLNQKVIILEKLNIDTIGIRIGNWVKIKHRHKQAYVFDGFLNKFRIEIGDMLFGNYFKQQLIEMYKMKKPTTIQLPCNGGKSCKTMKIYTTQDCYIRIDYGHEWWDGEIVLKNWSINELLNIIENANCYMQICDYNEIVKNIKNNFKKVTWNTQTDDIFTTEIEEGENGNTKIKISWAY